jgi:hypothetical protein
MAMRKGKLSIEEQQEVAPLTSKANGFESCCTEDEIDKIKSL